MTENRSTPTRRHALKAIAAATAAVAAPAAVAATGTTITPPVVPGTATPAGRHSHPLHLVAVVALDALVNALDDLTAAGGQTTAALDARALSAFATSTRAALESDLMPHHDLDALYRQGRSRYTGRGKEARVMLAMFDAYDALLDLLAGHDCDPQAAGDCTTCQDADAFVRSLHIHMNLLNGAFPSALLWERMRREQVSDTRKVARWSRVRAAGRVMPPCAQAEHLGDAEDGQ